MFHNITGELYAEFNNEVILAAHKKSGRQIYARGGVNQKSVALAYKLGFAGVALYSHLWKGESPSKKYVEFMKYCNEKNIPVD